MSTLVGLLYAKVSLTIMISNHIRYKIDLHKNFKPLDILLLIVTSMFFKVNVIVRHVARIELTKKRNKNRMY